MSSCPDFIIAGAAKSGTTALHYMLDQHPDIFMSGIKETNYFIQGFEPFEHWRSHSGIQLVEGQHETDIIDSKEKYIALFSSSLPGQITGESSPAYLMNASVPARIKSHNADTKIILILRNPSDVSYANFVHQVRDNMESIKVTEVKHIIRDEHYNKVDLHPFGFHLKLPEYSLQIPEYLKKINKKNIRIIVYEEFLKDKNKALSDLFLFLGVSQHIDINVDRRVNVSGLPKSKFIQNIIQGNRAWKKIVNLVIPKKPRRRIRLILESMNTGKKPVLDQSVRNQLDQYFLKDVEYLEEILERKIPVWREKSTSIVDSCE